jgi:hypothetical protein
MCELQGMFSCCKSCLPSDSSQCHLVIKAIIFVHNFRTEYVGYSQIKSVFDQEYVQCKNLHGYDRIAQYYFRSRDYDSEVDGVIEGSGESDEDSNKLGEVFINTAIITAAAIFAAATIVTTSAAATSPPPPAFLP